MMNKGRARAILLLAVVAALTGQSWRRHHADAARAEEVEVEVEVEGSGSTADASATEAAATATAAAAATPSFRLGEIEDEIGYEMTLLGYAPEDVGLIDESQSDHQTIEIYGHSKFGKILVLDGCVQLTERDADSYNEMLAHVPMFAHAGGDGEGVGGGGGGGGDDDGPRRVLVIGGGDGYVVSEVLKHKSVEHVDHVELDESVIRVCREHFAWGRAAWDDPRVTVHVADGASFLRDGVVSPAGTYDVIIQDSSDPFYVDRSGETVVLPSHVLYEPSHMANVHGALTENGVFAFQAETYNIPSSLDGVKEWRRAALEAGFETARYGTIATGSYPTGQIGFLLCEKSKKKAEEEEGESSSSSFSSIVRRFGDLEKPTTYYHPRMQRSCFDLPLWVEHYIYGEEYCNSEYNNVEEKE